jgi:hypothetical protein
MRRPSCEKLQKSAFSSRNPALMLANLKVVSLELKTRWTAREEHPAVLIIYQKDCVRVVKHSNELEMSPSTDPTSFCFIEAERVNLAEPERPANPLPPLPREEVVSLGTWDNIKPEFFVVSRNGAEDGGCIARGIPLGSSTLGECISDSCGGGLSSSSDIEERVDSGDGWS